MLTTVRGKKKKKTTQKTRTQKGRAVVTPRGFFLLAGETDAPRSILSELK